MRKVIIFSILFSLALLGILGCMPVMIGGAAGALGGYAVSRDTIQGDTDKPYENLWNAAVTVARIRGTIKEEDGLRGYIELEADSASQAWVRLIRLTHSTTRLRISARRYHLPHLALAEELFTKIMEEAK